MDDLQVLFDRDDRMYRIGEKVTGRVIVKAESGMECKLVAISYGWRTHGKGNRDKGPEHSLTLSGQLISLGDGERREFAFDFQPSGPVTYRGHHLNVDWYLKASAWRRYIGALQREEDFLLLGGPLGADISPRDADAGNPAQSGGNKVWAAIVGVLGILWVISIVGAVFWALALHGPAFTWIYAIAAVLVSVAAMEIHDNAYKRKLGVLQASALPAVVYAGGCTNCRLQFQVKRAVYLQKIEVRLAAEERVTQAAGTTARRTTYELYSKRFVKAFNEQLLRGRVVSFESSLPMPAGAPASFKSTNNELAWSVHLKVDLKGWPGFEKHFPITVLPGG